MKHLFSQDTAELLFRLFFCIIFIGLGGEHLVADDLIQLLMPTWVPEPRLISLLCGVWLVFWGAFIVLGYRLRLASIALGSFVIAVTVLVHLPGVFNYPAHLPVDSRWMWDILQRSNLAKNLCLIGVCFHLLHHEPGRYSLDALLRER